MPEKTRKVPKAYKKRSECRRGHLYSKENIVNYRSNSTGKLNRYCKHCMRINREKTLEYKKQERRLAKSIKKTLLSSKKNNTPNTPKPRRYLQSKHNSNSINRKPYKPGGEKISVSLFLTKHLNLLIDELTVLLKQARKDTTSKADVIRLLLAIGLKHWHVDGISHNPKIPLPDIDQLLDSYYAEEIKAG